VWLREISCKEIDGTKFYDAYRFLLNEGGRKGMRSLGTEVEMRLKMSERMG